ncbi:MAG: energy transducer TonB [Elusimicrobiota bacterium]|nr:energy transducer TonB [Elusimicrobiota bacterium]
MTYKSAAFSVGINIIIFSFLPLMHYCFHKPVSQIKAIQIDFISPKRKKTKPEKQRKKNKAKPLLKPKKKIKTELRRRIAFELDPNAFAGEVDLIAPMVTYDLSEVDCFPKLKKYVKPDYPDLASNKGIEGVAVLKILIDREGRVAMVKIQDNGGFYEFGRSASRAVRRWRFEPAKIMNMPVAAWCIQTVRFELDRD